MATRGIRGFTLGLSHGVAGVAVAAGAVLLALLGPVTASVAVSPAWRSGHPPVIQSATIDAQRRLVVVYTAEDGVTYGGNVYFGNDPRNATPVNSDPKYGQFMWCNNNSTCQGHWRLAETTPATGPFTFTSPALDLAQFPAGQYWVQVSTTNEDPYPSTRQSENSNIVTVTLPAQGGEGLGAGGQDTSEDFEFRYGFVQAMEPLDSHRATVEVWAAGRCLNALRFQVHVELQTLSGSPFAQAVLQGRVNSEGMFGVTRDFNVRLPAKGFYIVGRNFVCWRHDASQLVGYRGTFRAFCRRLPADEIGVSSRCHADVPTDDRAGLRAQEGAR